MPRPLRIAPPNTTHHVTARGVRKLPVFFDDVDFAYCVELLGRAAVRFGWLVPSYCLIPNHVHLLVFTPHGNLSQGMQWLHGTYGQWLTVATGSGATSSTAASTASSSRVSPTASKCSATSI